MKNKQVLLLLTSSGAFLLIRTNMSFTSRFISFSEMKPSLHTVGKARKAANSHPLMSKTRKILSRTCSGLPEAMMWKTTWPGTRGEERRGGGTHQELDDINGTAIVLVVAPEHVLLHLAGLLARQSLEIHCDSCLPVQLSPFL